MSVFATLKEVVECIGLCRVGETEQVLSLGNDSDTPKNKNVPFQVREIQGGLVEEYLSVFGV